MNLINEPSHYSAEYWIQGLNLIDHIEGGYYRRIYTSSDVIEPPGLPDRYETARHFASAIYYLLTEKRFSAFHILKSDEIWCHLDGSAITIHILDESGAYHSNNLGKDLSRGEVPQMVVPAGTLFAASIQPQGNYSLAACIVAPEFTFADFIMPGRQELIKRFPHQRELIESLTHPG
ncbi:MAG TPA: cupin domain-containing protein [Anaerolineaceae bacterium]